MSVILDVVRSGGDAILASQNTPLSGASNVVAADCASTPSSTGGSVGQTHRLVVADCAITPSSTSGTVAPGVGHFVVGANCSSTPTSTGGTVLQAGQIVWSMSTARRLAVPAAARSLVVPS